MLYCTIYKPLENFILDVEFNVGKEIMVLVGPSGAGKTTILNCIAGLTHPERGNIQLYNRPLYKDNSKPVVIQKRKIGYLFQNYALFPHMTVEKNITYAMKDQETVDKLINIVGIGHLLDNFPSQISGGEKQRVALVRALATKPTLLLLDEPFSALDEKTRRECQDELLRLHREWEIPIIMVTHNMKEAKKMGDQIIEINKGRISHRITI